MENDIVQSAVQQAVRQAYADWAVEHPNLAAVIDRIVIFERSAERLRETDEYKQAVAGYHESRNELDLFNQLLALAGPILQQLLG
ncbi:MAG: hypothetical protein JW849_05415 [Phycisphaerae bacterium]|nr:hypothetical protein [Phycisphaerae bacterium]